MQFSTHYEPEQNVLYSRATGAASIEDIMDYYSEIEGLGLKYGYSVLADCREAAIGDVGYNDIVKIVERRRRLHQELRPTKIAAVAKSDVVFGMIRVFGALLCKEPVEVNVFRDQEKAMQWLGVHNVNYVD